MPQRCRLDAQGDRHADHRRPLDPEAAAFVEERVAAGDFASADGAVAAALKLLKENQGEIEEIRDLLSEAEEEVERIGFNEDFDLDEFLARKRAAYNAKCRG